MKNHWLDKKEKACQEIAKSLCDKIVEKDALVQGLLQKAELKLTEFDTDIIHDECLAQDMEFSYSTCFQEKNELKIPDLDCGNLVIQDFGRLGFDVCSKDNKEKILFLNAVSEQKLVSWILKKHVNEDSWISKAIGNAFKDSTSDELPLCVPSDELSLQQGDIYGTESNLDIYYASQLVQSEVLTLHSTSYVTSEQPSSSGLITKTGYGPAEKIPMLDRTAVGTIWIGDTVAAEFSPHQGGYEWVNNIEVTPSVRNINVNETTGVITVIWEGVPEGVTKVVVDYECYNLEI